MGSSTDPVHGYKTSVDFQQDELTCGLYFIVLRSGSDILTERCVQAVVDNAELLALPVNASTALKKSMFGK